MSSRSTGWRRAKIKHFGSSISEKFFLVASAPIRPPNSILTPIDQVITGDRLMDYLGEEEETMVRGTNHFQRLLRPLLVLRRHM